MKSTDGMPRNNIVITRKRIFNGKPISNTRRVERCLKLIIWLQDFRTIREIAKHLNIHEKSVNRYLNLLVQLGFEVEVGHKRAYNYYRITNTKEYFKIK